MSPIIILLFNKGSKPVITAIPMITRPIPVYLYLGRGSFNTKLDNRVTKIGAV